MSKRKQLKMKNNELLRRCGFLFFRVTKICNLISLWIYDYQGIFRLQYCFEMSMQQHAAKMFYKSTSKDQKIDPLSFQFFFQGL